MLDLPVSLTDTVLSPARICTIELRNGTIIRLAEAQEAIVVPAVGTYEPLAGFQMSAIKHRVGSEPASLQIDAAMSAGGTFDTYRIIDGFFDAAEVRVDVVDRANPTTRGFLFSGWIGPVRFGALRSSVSFDVRGHASRYKWPFVQSFGPMCRTTLGSDLCRIPLRPSEVARNTAYVTKANAYSVDVCYVRVSNGGSDPDQYDNKFFECTTAGTTAGSAPSYSFTVGNTTTDGSAVFTCRNAWTRHAKVETIVNQFNVILDRDPDPRAVSGWYNQGAIRLWDGYSATRTFVIGNWISSTRTITLYLPCGAANNDTLFHSGDWLEIWRGCDRTIATCSGTFDNSLNFRGEPYFAGAAAAAQQAPLG